MPEQTFQLTGLTCEGCARFTAKRLRRIEAVTDVTVDLRTMVARVTAERAIAKEEVRGALADTHYGVAD